LPFNSTSLFKGSPLMLKKKLGKKHWLGGYYLATLIINGINVTKYPHVLVDMVVLAIDKHLNLFIYEIKHL
jgi:hypothetical protein